MATTYDTPRDVLVNLAVAPETRELVRQLKSITGARNIDVFLAPLLKVEIRRLGARPTKKAKAL